MTLHHENSIYVIGLANDSTEDLLQEAFEIFGVINSIRIVYDQESGQSRGFGFVTFSNSRAATNAINGLDGRVLGGRTIRVNGSPYWGSRNIFRSVSDRGDLTFLEFDSDSFASSKKDETIF